MPCLSRRDSSAGASGVEPGVYYVGGKGPSMTVNPDGTKTLDLGKNVSAENICAALTG